MLTGTQYWGKDHRYDSAVTWRIISVLYVEILAVDIFIYSSSSVLQMSLKVKGNDCIHILYNFVYNYLAYTAVA